MAFKYKFQHFMDIHTSTDSVTMLQIQAGGDYAMERCKHLWGAFKYCKLGSLSVKFLPMSTLPVDPAHMAYASDDPYDVDPRDQANPGLVRITNGEDILTNLSGLSDEQIQQMYINTMLDPRWSKFMLQRGFTRKAVPLYWNVGNLAQTPYPNMVENIPAFTSNTTITETDAIYPTVASTQASGAMTNGTPEYVSKGYSDPRGLFQTGHKGRLGWMPTDSMQVYAAPNGSIVTQPMAQPLPAVNVITAILPKAYKTEYYYRVYITETVYFSGVKNTGINEAGREYRAFDNFMQVFTPQAMAPSDATFAMSGISGRPEFGQPNTKNDGGE